MTLQPLSDATSRILYPYQRTACQQLVRALTNGHEEWGYNGAADLSDVGVGKSFIDYGAALETGRDPIILTPLAGFTGWQQTCNAFKHHPRYVGTPDGLKQGNRSHIATRHGDEFRWRGAANSILILDEAQAFKGMDSIARRLIDGAMAQHIPIICASATLATSPLELRIAGAVTGLHSGTPPDWERFMVRNGCRYVDDETGWQWNRKVHYLEQIHFTLIPNRGCRVRKSDMGERPGSTIEILPIQCEEGPQIQREWSSALDQLRRMEAQRYPKMVVINTRRKIRMRLWKMSEQALVPHVARLMQEDLAQGKSVIGFFTFSDTREQMGKLLKTKDGFFGGQPADVRARLARDFQANRIRVLLNQIKAGGSSVSLHDLDGGHPRVSYIFPSDSGIAMQQAPGRTDRAGMQSHATVWIPCVQGSLSESLVKSTSRKLLAMGALNNGAVE
jgi:hypothetical protein